MYVEWTSFTFPRVIQWHNVHLPSKAPTYNPLHMQRSAAHHFIVLSTYNLRRCKNWVLLWLCVPDVAEPFFEVFSESTTSSCWHSRLLSKVMTWSSWVSIISWGMLWQYQKQSHMIITEADDDTNLKKPSNIGDIIDMMVHVEISSSWLQRNTIIKSFLECWVLQRILLFYFIP